MAILQRSHALRANIAARKKNCGPGFNRNAHEDGKRKQAITSYGDSGRNENNSGKGAFDIPWLLADYTFLQFYKSYHLTSSTYNCFVFNGPDIIGCTYCHLS